MIVPPGGPVLLWGMGATNVAVAAALARRGHEHIAVDDDPEGARCDPAPLGAPTGRELAALMKRCSAFVPTPGMADGHEALVAADAVGTPVLSELDLAEAWDDRPTVAITGTNGKTTVVAMTTAALSAATGALCAGNNELPLVGAIADPTPDLFVVEASSFRLGRSQAYRPKVAAWLNFSPDHLDVHADLDAYKAAKATIWRHLGGDDIAVVNQADPVVSAQCPRTGQVITFGGGDGDLACRDHRLFAFGEELMELERLPRRFPHDILNAQAAAAVALAAGASSAEVHAALANFRGLPHRLELVTESRGLRWYNDSKSTTPAATVAAAVAFDSVVLIAGGRNKGLDLGILTGASSVRAVVAMGEAAEEIRGVFGGSRPIRTAPDMEAAVEVAGALAAPGDAILLSPGCASFDAYESYRARGAHFASVVRSATGVGE